MSTRWRQREDELRRTTFAGQVAIDGSVVEQDVVAPRPEPEHAEAPATEPMDEGLPYD